MAKGPRSLEDELDLAPDAVIGAPAAQVLAQELTGDEVLQTNFLQAYAACGTIQKACAETKISRDRVSRWKKTDLAFQTAFDLADSKYTEKLEEILDRQVEKNPILLMFALKKRDPSYRENFKMEHSGEVAIRVVRYDETPETPPTKTIEATAENCSPK